MVSSIYDEHLIKSSVVEDYIGIQNMNNSMYCFLWLMEKYSYISQEPEFKELKFSVFGTRVKALAARQVLSHV